MHDWSFEPATARLLQAGQHSRQSPALFITCKMDAKFQLLFMPSSSFLSSPMHVEVWCDRPGITIRYAMW